MNFGILGLCRLVRARENPYFIGTFGILCATMATEVGNLRNNVALENRSEFRQKRLKMPENSPFLLGIAVHSNLRGGSMSPRLFLQQNTVKPEFYYLSPNCRILRSLAWWRT